MKTMKIKRESCHQKGSALTWVMVVSLVLLILLTVGLTIASYSNNRAASSHTQDQAYYTALSATQTFEEWIVSGSDEATPQSEKDKIGAFLDTVIASAEGISISFTADQLPMNTGTCDVNIKYTGGENPQIKITSTATYQGSTETVSVTMVKAEGVVNPALAYPATDYSVSQYDETVEGLNNISIGSATVVGKTTGSNNTNAYDLTQTNNITGNGESRFEDGSSDGVSATRQSSTGANTSVNDRKWFIPENGRLTFNPLQSGDSSSSTNNTNFTMLAIDNRPDDAEERDVKIRLAGYGSSTRAMTNALIGLDFINNYDKTTDTDINESNENVDYLIGESAVLQNNQLNISHNWHPINWESCTVFTQTRIGSSGDNTAVNAGIDTNLIFGGYGNKYASYFDYWGHGQYTSNHYYSATNSNYIDTAPYVTNSTAKNSKGVPFIPVYYGNNFNMYFLDTIDKDARLLQGVNIFSGTIYSYRGLTLGGGLVKSGHANSNTTDDINGSSSVGYAYEDGTPHTVYTNRTLRWDQVISDTDIILVTPPGMTTTRSSTIRRPDNYASPGINVEVLVDDPTLKNFAPKEKIVGGTIYVGTGQTLTIQGSKTYTKSNYTGTGNSGTKNVFSQVLVKPNQIVIDGGAVVIETSEDVNIQTDIYVRNSGRLTINTGAKIKGNIYAYNGGEVIILGAFELDSAKETSEERVMDGIRIYGQEAVDNAELVGITAPGHITLPSAASPISGDAGHDGTTGKIHILGDYGDLVSVTSGPLATPANTLSLCDGHDTNNGECHHFGAVGGSWTVGRFSDE
jgi:Tfp pilus assembly protein PilX